jgi:hypothetical protein
MTQSSATLAQLRKWRLASMTEEIHREVSNLTRPLDSQKPSKDAGNESAEHGKQ